MEEGELLCAPPGLWSRGRAGVYERDGELVPQWDLPTVLVGIVLGILGVLVPMERDTRCRLV